MITSSGTTPGGWLTTINSYGTVVQMAHESKVYSKNDTIASFNPLSEVLTGNTIERREDIIVTSGDFVLPNQAPLVLPDFGSVVDTNCDNPPQELTLIILPDDQLSGDPLGSTHWITPGAGTSVASMDSAFLSISPDGFNWTSDFDNSPGFFVDCLLFGNSTYLALGGGAATSPGQGNAWTTQSLPTGDFINGGVFAGGKFVVGGSSGVIFVSTDGVSWNDNSPGAPADFETIGFGGGLYVAVGDSGIIYTSPDAVTWSAQTSGTSSNLNGVAYGNGKYVAVGRDAVVLTSPDGITWTPQTFPTGDNINDVAFGAGTFMAVTAGPDAYTSADGITWTLFKSADGGETFVRMSYFRDSLFIACTNQPT